MRAKSACLAFAALVFSGAAASREPEVSLTEIDASRWKIAYRLDAPAEALHFARTLPELRGLCRRPADKAFGVSGAADAETLRRADGAPFAESAIVAQVGDPRPAIEL